MEDIICIKIREIENFEDNSGEFNLYVKKDKNFNEKLEGLKNILNTYENYQEIEEFIQDNFETINIEEIEIYY